MVVTLHEYITLRCRKAIVEDTVLIDSKWDVCINKITYKVYMSYITLRSVVTDSVWRG